MVRAVVAVIVGYVVMAVTVFTVFTCAYLALGAEGAFKPGSYEVSGTWLVIAMAVGLFAAFDGGAVCRLIAQSERPACVLAALVLVLGLALAGLSAASPRPDPGARAGNVGNIEAMGRARQPFWIEIVNPFLGAGGVLAGAAVVGMLRGGAQRKGPAL